jgi:cyclase
VLKVRVIPTLLYRDFGLVKGVGFDSRRAVGGAMQAVKVYEQRAVDELVFFDVTATAQGRDPDYGLIDDLADECFMPLTVGGGVRTVEHIRRLLVVGADKVAIGTACLDAPEIVDEGARAFGSQCIVAVVDTRTIDGVTTVWSRSATVDTGRDAVDVACEMADRGAGEILLQSADRDGAMAGYDLDTLAGVADAVPVPVIASGGAGDYDHLGDAVQKGGASAVAAASMFHYTQQTPLEAKRHLADRGVPVRLPT